MKKKILVLGVVSIFSLPVTAVAAVKLEYINSIISGLSTILSSLPPILVAAAVVYFLYGVLKFVASGDEEEGRKAGRQRMIHGIIAIAVMVSLWGLVGILQDTLGINTDKDIKPASIIKSVNY